jgi:hypothetical protein
MRTIQTCGTYNGEYYSVLVAIGDAHAVTLEGLSHEDILQLKSCIDCMLLEDEDDIGTTT